MDRNKLGGTHSIATKIDDLMISFAKKNGVKWRDLTNNLDESKLDKHIGAIAKIIHDGLQKAHGDTDYRTVASCEDEIATRIAHDLFSKKKRVVIMIDEMDERSIKKAERQKMRLENDGYILVDSKSNPFRSSLTYELPKNAKNLISVSEFDISGELLKVARDLVGGAERDYLFLGRMQSDLDYALNERSLGYGAEKHLMMLNFEDQIKEMKKLWNRVDEKPEWLTKRDIADYEKRIKKFRRRTKASRDMVSFEV